MFNLCDNKIQLVLYFTTVATMALGIFYVCMGGIIIGEFRPLLPGVFQNPLWGLLYLYMIATGVYTVLAGCIGLCGIDKYQTGSICLHRVLVLLLVTLHGLAIYVFIKDAGYNRDRMKSYLARSTAQILSSDGMKAAKANEKVWNYFESALNCKRTLKNCNLADTIAHLMVSYYTFVGFLCFCALVLLIDLVLTFLL